MTQANLRSGGCQAMPESNEAAHRCAQNEPRNLTNLHDAKPTHTCRVCPKAVTWTWSNFNDLPTSVLYAALRLRQDIFIVEQNVPYFDIDGRDPESMHLLGVLNGELVAYLRALPCGLFEPGYASFGRVVVHAKARGLGLGRKLVEQCVIRFDLQQSPTPIKISSQFYLKSFYETFDFIPVGEPYIEDKIPHIAMIRN